MTKTVEEITDLELQAENARYLRKPYNSLMELAKESDPDEVFTDIGFSGRSDKTNPSFQLGEIYFNALIQFDGTERNLSFTQKARQIMTETVIDFLNDSISQILSIAAKKLETDIRNNYNELSSAVSKISPDLTSIVLGDSK